MGIQPLLLIAGFLFLPLLGNPTGCVDKSSHRQQFRDGISALLRRARRASLLSVPLGCVRGGEKASLCKPGGRALVRNRFGQHLDLGHPSLWSFEKYVFVVEATHSVVFVTAAGGKIGSVGQQERHLPFGLPLNV